MTPSSPKEKRKRDEKLTLSPSSNDFWKWKDEVPKNPGSWDPWYALALDAPLPENFGTFVLDMNHLPTLSPRRLDGPRHHHSLRGLFSAGSTPIFASKYAFFSIFQDLQETHLLASKFAKIWKFSRHCKIFENCLEIFRKYGEFYKILQTVCRIFTEFLQNLNWIL